MSQIKTLTTEAKDVLKLKPNEVNGKTYLHSGPRPAVPKSKPLIGVQASKVAREKVVSKARTTAMTNNQTKPPTLQVTPSINLAALAKERASRAVHPPVPSNPMPISTKQMTPAEKSQLDQIQANFRQRQLQQLSQVQPQYLLPVQPPQQVQPQQVQPQQVQPQQVQPFGQPQQVQPFGQPQQVQPIGQPQQVQFLGPQQQPQQQGQPRPQAEMEIDTELPATSLATANGQDIESLFSFDKTCMVETEDAKNELIKCKVAIENSLKKIDLTNADVLQLTKNATQGKYSHNGNKRKQLTLVTEAQKCLGTIKKIRKTLLDVDKQVVELRDRELETAIFVDKSRKKWQKEKKNEIRLVI